MVKFHINTETGDPGKCKAEKGQCPFGKDDEHYTTASAARKAFEERMSENKTSLIDESSIFSGIIMLNNLSVEGDGPNSFSKKLDFRDVLVKSPSGNFYEIPKENKISGPFPVLVYDVYSSKAIHGWKLITADKSSGHKGPWLPNSEGVKGDVARAVKDGPPGLYTKIRGYQMSTQTVAGDSKDKVALWSIAYKSFEDLKNESKP